MDVQLHTKQTIQVRQAAGNDWSLIVRTFKASCEAALCAVEPALQVRLSTALIVLLLPYIEGIDPCDLTRAFLARPRDLAHVLEAILGVTIEYPQTRAA